VKHPKARLAQVTDQVFSETVARRRLLYCANADDTRFKSSKV
ncbi:uncharacterized protein METZ01_LOCUS128408, partial [marine metagenome]